MTRFVEGDYSARDAGPAPLMDEGFDMEGGTQPSFFETQSTKCDRCGITLHYYTLSWASPGVKPSLLCDPCHEEVMT